MMKLGILIQELVVRLLYWLNIMPLYTRKNKDSTKKTLRKVPKSHPEQLYIDIKNKRVQLKCGICNHDKFYTKLTMIRGGRWASFWDTEWIFDKSAQLTICENCSNCMMFKNRKAIHTKDS